MLTSKPAYKLGGREAVECNFRRTDAIITLIRKAALKNCKIISLSSLLKFVEGVYSLSLKQLFSAKKHRALTPFRAVVRRGGAWPERQGSYLQKGLGHFVSDPLLIGNSELMVAPFALV